MLVTVAERARSCSDQGCADAAMTDLLQLVVAGLSPGAVYALVAIGFVAIFTVSEVINLAQGEFAALAGLVAISRRRRRAAAAARAAGLPSLTVAIVAVLMRAADRSRR